MSRENKEASSFLAKFKKQIEESPKQSHSTLAVLETPNAFRSVFAIQDLDQVETQELKQLLENSAPEDKDPYTIQHDFDLLKNITAEIKSIQKQSILLLGERIVKAKTILDFYGNGLTTFTKWLDATFSSRRTAYNCMAYHEFYHALPSDHLRQRLKLMSYKAVYMLASRAGTMEQKVKIVETYYALKQEDIIPIIQEAFPVQETEKKGESALEGDLEELERVIERLFRRSQQLKPKHRQRLKAIKELMIGLTL
ncbi:MAG: CT583 family protein [Simkania sp.]|nr:CT583 family protein [Simkania sp.]